MGEIVVKEWLRQRACEVSIHSHHDLSEVKDALPLAVKVSKRLLSASGMLVKFDAPVSDVIPGRCLHHTLELHV